VSDPRQDDLRTTYDEVTIGLEALAETEARKQASRPGTERHASLARKARSLAERLRHSTAIEAELAEQLEADPGPRPA
jgi:hypothetical protein